jgi:outer membrane protein assembly factor BamE (lipoprotein component of BamABCDE complex)
MKYVPLLFLLVLIAGCAVRSGHELNMAEINAIERGKTTKQQVLDRFGTPMQTTQGSSGEMWAYSYVDAGYGTPIGIVGKNTRMDTLTITFDGEVVKDFSYQFSNSKGSKNPLGI